MFASSEWKCNTPVELLGVWQLNRAEAATSENVLLVEPEKTIEMRL